MIASRNPAAFDEQDREMYALIASGARCGPGDVFPRLIEISSAITAVFGSVNNDIFENKAALAGFYLISDALTRGLEDLSYEVDGHVRTVDYLIAELDKVQAEARVLREKLACYDFVRDHSAEEIERMAADLPAVLTPDLSEPVGGAEGGIEDPGGPATLAG